MNALNRHLCLCLMGLSLFACESNNSSRYTQKQDSAPQFRYGELELEDAVPRYEPYAPANSRPYTVFGEYYTPMFTGKIELYDMSNDAGEKHDYAQRRPDLARHAANLLDKYHEPDPNWKVRGRRKPSR